MTLTEYLKEHDLSPARFAADLAVSPSAVTRWIRGERRPDLESLAAIEKATKGKVGLADFLPREREAAE